MYSHFGWAAFFRCNQDYAQRSYVCWKRLEIVHQTSTRFVRSLVDVVTLRLLFLFACKRPRTRINVVIILCAAHRWRSALPRFVYSNDLHNCGCTHACSYCCFLTRPRSVCLSFRPSVRPSVCLSVRLLTRTCLHCAGAAV